MSNRLFAHHDQVQELFALIQANPQLRCPVNASSVDVSRLAEISAEEMSSIANLNTPTTRIIGKGHEAGSSHIPLAKFIEKRMARDEAKESG